MLISYDFLYKQSRPHVIIDQLPMDREKKLYEKLSSLYAKQKRIENELYMIQKNRRRGRKSCAMDGVDIGKLYNAKFIVPIRLKRILKIEETHMSRCDVTSYIYQYLKRNNLIDTKTKEINADSNLRELFDMGEFDRITFYNIQKLINDLY